MASLGSGSSDPAIRITPEPNFSSPNQVSVLLALLDSGVARTSVRAAVVPPTRSQASWSTIQLGESHLSSSQLEFAEPDGLTIVGRSLPVVEVHPTGVEDAAPDLVGLDVRAQSGQPGQRRIRQGEVSLARKPGQRLADVLTLAVAAGAAVVAGHELVRHHNGVVAA